MLRIGISPIEFLFLGEIIKVPNAISKMQLQNLAVFKVYNSWSYPLSSCSFITTESGRRPVNIWAGD